MCLRNIYREIYDASTKFADAIPASCGPPHRASMSLRQGIDITSLNE
jgi:hypothetical protein